MSSAMTDAKSQLTNRGFPQTTDPRVVILYEDILAAEVGRGIAQEFIGRGEPLNGDIAAWNAALIDEPYFARHIQEQADHAQVIIIAICGNFGLTQTLKRWIYQWAMQSDYKHRALAIVVEAPQTPSVSKVPFFAECTARHGGLEFYHHKEEAGSLDDSLCRYESIWLI
jgi:hypothetical protein